MDRQYDVLAIDLDGTLLVGEEVPEANVQAIRAARDAGYFVLLATARWAHMAMRVQQVLGFSDLLIACSGAQVRDPVASADVFDERLSVEVAEALFAICNAERCIATVTFDDHVNVKMDGNPDLSLFDAEMSPTQKLVLNDRDLPRVAAVQGSACNARIRAELEQEFADHVNVFDSIGPNGKLVLTITSKRASKGEALKAACTRLGVSPGRVVAFGDAENDLEMFRLAGASVAMGQADEKTKAAATYVSRANTEAGVGYAIDRLLQQGTL